MYQLTLYNTAQSCRSSAGAFHPLHPPQCGYGGRVVACCSASVQRVCGGGGPQGLRAVQRTIKVMSASRTATFPKS